MTESLVRVLDAHGTYEQDFWIRICGEDKENDLCLVEFFDLALPGRLQSFFCARVGWCQLELACFWPTHVTDSAGHPILDIQKSGEILSITFKERGTLIESTWRVHLSDFFAAVLSAQ
jgi:hypothetical protein